MVSRFSPPIVDVLLCVQFFYRMGNTLLDYAEFEENLGIIMTRTEHFTKHANSLYNRANQRLSCHFIDGTPNIIYTIIIQTINLLT